MMDEKKLLGASALAALVVGGGYLALRDNPTPPAPLVAHDPVAEADRLIFPETSPSISPSPQIKASPQPVTPRSEATPYQTPARKDKSVADQPRAFIQDPPVSSNPAGVLTASLQRTAWIIPVWDSRFRMNLGLNTNADLPTQVWQGESWLQFIQADSGTFPVRLWIVRGGVPHRMADLRIPARRMQFVNVPLAPYGVKAGDLVVVEFSPGLMTSQTPNGMIGPIVSIIDQTSNDPTTMLPILTPFTP